jgi:hypothetical protein
LSCPLLAQVIQEHKHGGYAGGCCFVEPIDEEIDSTFTMQPEDKVIDEILNMLRLAALENVMTEFLIEG